MGWESKWNVDFPVFFFFHFPFGMLAPPSLWTTGRWPPDEPFPNFRAPKSVDWRILRCSGTSYDGFLTLLNCERARQALMFIYRVEQACLSFFFSAGASPALSHILIWHIYGFQEENCMFRMIFCGFILCPINNVCGSNANSSSYPC